MSGPLCAPRLASRLAACLFVVTLLAGPAAGQAPPGRFSFAVVGHIRGNSDDELHPLIDELIEQLRQLKPDILFLTGDLIWGSVPLGLADPAVVRAQWDRLDAKLATLGIPIYRVPGNHDIHEPVTRDVFRERYGELPRTVVFRGTRFFLLNSTFVAPGNDTVPLSMKLGKTVRLDSVQVDFVREALLRESFSHNFLLMHHVLWFNEDDPWWQEMHPALAKQGVDAVFAGDQGPTIYTHLKRDGVEYFRSALNANAHKPLKLGAVDPLLRWLQFETFLFVKVDGPAVTYDVHTVGALTSPVFSPERWREVFGPGRDPGRYYDPANPPTEPQRSAEPSLRARIWRLVGSPRRLAAIVLFAVLVFSAGVIVGRRWRTSKAIA